MSSLLLPGYKQFTIMLSVLAMALVLQPATGKSQAPDLIEFGWDYPDVSQLKGLVQKYPNTPFKGICFSLQREIMESFDTTEKPASYFNLKELRTLKWGKYSSNYIILRGFSKTGGNWLSDQAWVIIDKNMKALSMALLTGKLKGILFDPEYYYENKLYNPWTYSKAQYPNHTFEEMQDTVRKRGMQFMQSLQYYKTDLTFISIWFTSLIAEEKKYTPFESTRHALLLSFLEGMLLAKNKKVTIIDGNEYAYWNFKPSQFTDARNFLQQNTTNIMRANKAKAVVNDIPTASTLFYDGILATAPSFDKKLSCEAKWNWLKENIKFSLFTADHTVWFYSERLNWWKGKQNDTLTYLLNYYQQLINGDNSLKNGLIKDSTVFVTASKPCKGTAVYYLADPKTPMQQAGTAFSFEYTPSAKQLAIYYNETIPATLKVYTRNRLTATILPSGKTDLIKIKNFNRGPLIIIAHYKSGLEAAGVIVVTGAKTSKSR